jgi:hypothetical protein
MAAHPAGHPPLTDKTMRGNKIGSRAIDSGLAQLIEAALVEVDNREVLATVEVEATG